MKKLFILFMVFVLLIIPFNVSADSSVYTLEGKYIVDESGNLLERNGAYSEIEYIPVGVTKILDFVEDELSRNTRYGVKKVVTPWTCKYLNTTALNSIAIENGYDLIISDGCEEVWASMVYGGGTPQNIKSVKIPDSVEYIRELALGTWFDDTVGVKPIQDFIIYCYEGSYAQSYAEKYNITCSILEPVLGDSTGDDEFTIGDTIRIMRYLAGEDVPIFERGADVNFDDKVDTKDCLMIKKLLAGYPIEK